MAMTPLVHLNGTSAEELTRQYEAAYRALDEARDKVAAAAPNGRDYYPLGPDAYTQAAREHEDRMKKLNLVFADIETTLMALLDGASGGER